MQSSHPRLWPALPLLFCLLATPPAARSAAIDARKVVTTGDALPGGAAGQVFTRFDHYAYSGGTAAFIGAGSAGGAGPVRRGVYTQAGAAAPARLADSSTVVPGTMNTFARFDLVSTHAGQVAFTGGLAPGFRYGVYLGGGLTVVADTAMLAPGRTENFNFFLSPSLESGVVAFIGRSRDAGAFPFQPDVAYQGVYRSGAGGLTVVAEKGTPIPLGLGARFNRFPNVWLAGGRVSFVGANDSADFPAPATRVRGVYSDRVGGLARVADLTTPIAPVTGFDFSVLSRGRVTYLAEEDAGRKAVFTDLPLPPLAGPRRLVDTATPLPDAAGRRLETIRSFGFSRRLVVVWGGPDAVNTRLYAVRGNGLERLVGPGDTIGGKMIRSVAMTPECLDDHELMFEAVFADGSRGLFVLAVPRQVNACLDFTGSGLGAAARTAFLAQVQEYFTRAGFGPMNSNRVIVLDRHATPAPRLCDVTGRFVPGTGALWGNSFKQRNDCEVHVTTFTAIPAARRQQAMAETMAHEIGHLLCAVHDCRNGGGVKPAALGGGACAGAVGTASLMTVGTCVNDANRGHPHGRGGRDFSAASIANVREGIKGLTGAKVAWSLDAAFDAGILRVIQGANALVPIPAPGGDLRPENSLVNFTYDILTGDESLFEFGWLNALGDFIEPLPLVDNPDRLLEAHDDDQIHFALRGRPGTPYEGQVFPQKDHATPVFGGFEFPSSLAATPCPDTYYSRVRLDFDAAGHPFSVLLDTEEWGADNGFALTTEDEDLEDVTSLLDLGCTPGAFNPASRRWEMPVSLCNLTGRSFRGPVFLAVDRLPPGISLVRALGQTECAAPLGAPYVMLDIGPDGELTPGECLDITLEFLGTRNTAVPGCFLRVLAGPARP